MTSTTNTPSVVTVDGVELSADASRDAVQFIAAEQRRRNLYENRDKPLSYGPNIANVRPYPDDSVPSATAIPFGVDVDGNEVTVNILDETTLLGGCPGAGKTCGVNTLLAGLSRLENVALIGLDPARVDLDPWKSRFSRITRTEDEATVVLTELRAEILRRYDWLQNRGLRKIRPAQMAEMPLIVLVIGEMVDVMNCGVDPDEKAADYTRASLIRWIVGKGRAAGVSVIAATQKPQSDVVPSELRSQFGNRIAYATATEAMTDVILGSGLAQTGAVAHHIPADARGVCYVTNTTDRMPVLTRTYLIPDFDENESAPNPLRARAEATAALRVELPWLPAAPAKP